MHIYQDNEVMVKLEGKLKQPLMYKRAISQGFSDSPNIQLDNGRNHEKSHKQERI